MSMLFSFTLFWIVYKMLGISQIIWAYLENNPLILCDCVQFHLSCMELFSPAYENENKKCYKELLIPLNSVDLGLKSRYRYQPMNFTPNISGISAVDIVNIGPISTDIIRLISYWVPQNLKW